MHTRPKTVLQRTCVALVLAMIIVACASPAEKAVRYLGEAQRLYEAGDLVRAKLELRNALQIEPRNARALYLLAQIDERDEDYGAVVGNLQMAVEADPKFVDARVKLGNYFAAGNKIDEARTQADAAMALAPNSPSVRLLNARTLYLAGDKAKALDEARNALRLDPQRADAVTLAATILADEGKADEALAALTEAIGVASPQAAEGLRRVRVTLLVNLGRSEDAEHELLQMVKDYSGSPAYDLALVRLYSAAGRTADAEARTRELIARDPDNAQWRVQLAGLLATQTKTADAVASLEAAVREKPDSTTLRFALAGLYESMGRPADAIAIYEKVAGNGPTTDDGLAARSRIVALTMETDEPRARQLVADFVRDAPANADALTYRAAYSIMDGKLQEAIGDLRSALVRQPNSERALLMLARTYVLNKNAALAEDAYRKLLALNPAVVPARTELAAVVAGRGDMQEAEALLRKSLEMRPGDRDSARGLAAALLSQGDFKAAESEARRAIQTGDSSGLADFQLGLALEGQQDTGRAIAAYKDAVAKNPGAEAPLSELVTLLVKSGRAADAQTYLEGLAKAHPEIATPMVLLGTLYRDAGKTDLARATFRDVLARNPDDTRAYLGLASSYPPNSSEYLDILRDGNRHLPADPQLGLALGVAYEKRGNFDQAIATYEDSLKAGGGSEFLVSNLAVLLLDVRTDAASHQRALKLLAPFEENARHPFELGVIGWAHYRNGEYPAAVRFLERAVAASPVENPQLRYYLGMAYLRASNPVGARQALRLAVDTAASKQMTFTGLDEARKALETLR